jgi:hypothetical protein
MVERRLTGMIAAAAALMIILIFWDAFRPKHPRRAVQPHAPTMAVSTPAQIPPPAPPPAPVPVPQAGMTLTEGTETPSEPREPTYIEMLARAETRRRIRASGTGTYLAEMVASSDSTLRRWDNRERSPIRVWIAPSTVSNFQPAFIAAVRGAFDTWTSVGVPVRFDFEADSEQAEVVVRWRIQFEIERTGQTDVRWDDNGEIQSAIVTFATFDPKSRPLGTDDIRVVALHEAGHVLGLDHSSDSTDIMYPTAKVRALSSRDIRTAVLLYQLSPGSLR